MVVIFFFNDTATTEIYTLSLHDALPISQIPERLNVLMNVLKYPIHFHAWTPFELFELFEQARTVLPYPYEIECFKANEAEALFVLRRTDRKSTRLNSSHT